MRRRSLLGLICFVLLPSAVMLGPAAAEQSEPSDPYEHTESLTRTRPNKPDVTNNVTVRVDHTQNLRGRERVHVSWEGAHVSAGRAGEPRGFSTDSLAQEYPVVILQCRGHGDDVTPETCWTSHYVPRTAVRAHSAPDVAVWRHDAAATAAERASYYTGSIPSDDPDVLVACPKPAVFLNQSKRVTPFTAADGTVYPFCSTASSPPESTVLDDTGNPVVPPADVWAFTAKTGTGAWDFEVRTKTENESLGCSDQVDCSLVVIPIMGISCVDTNAACNKEGGQIPGEPLRIDEQHPVDDAVTGAYWWSASNWKHRFVVPLGFAPPPDYCDVLDDREPISFFGSELLNQATLQWAPAYCLADDRFKFNHRRQADGPAFRLMAGGDAAAAFVSGTQPNDGTIPIGYAPTAVTGFSVGFIVDQPNSVGEQAELKLNARLLAKLLTESYPSQIWAKAHPGLDHNPLTIQADPEFRRLNPGLEWPDPTNPDGQRTDPAAAVMLMLNESSEVVRALTSYIAADADAMAFIGGQADPDGMTVNPNYKAMSLPVDVWPLLDNWLQPSDNDPCLAATTSDAYLSRLAAPVKGLSTITTALIDQRATSITNCKTDTSVTPPYSLKRVNPQPYGSRFLIGITSLGDAERYGLHGAALETDDGSFVTATSDSLTKAVAAAKQGPVTEAFSLEAGALRAVPGAYPGAQIVYTAARLCQTDTADATKIAQFIRIASSEGQSPGGANGQLPDGYLPMTKDGVTAALWSRAQEVAGLIGKQAGLPGTGCTTPSQGPGGGSPSVVAPQAVAAPAAPGTADTATTTYDTVSLSSRLAHLLFPLLMVAAVVAGAGAQGIRLADFLRRIR